MMAEPVSFTFEGQAVTARPGQSIAAALTEAGIRGLRETKSGAVRGLFCGMGVCQECLVEIDGRQNQRACMAKPSPGMAVRRQAAFPRLGPSSEAGPALPGPERLSPDILIVGGGAAGLSAAVTAREAGVGVLVIDDRPVPGGQYYKQAAAGAPLDAQQRDGAALVDRARSAGAEIRGNVEVWGAFEGPVIHAASGGRPLILSPKVLIVATGAYERPIPVPGWDLPGVMTTGAAQTLWRSYRTLPGRRVAIAGNGPLNFQVARELMRGGAEISLIAEAAAPPWAAPGAAARMMAADRRLALTGAATLAWLARHGAAPRFRTRLRAIRPSGDALEIEVRDAAGRTRRIEADALCMNQGFLPQNEILRLLGAAMDYDAVRGQLVPRRSETCETTVPGLYAIGDCAGMGGAPAAQVEGRIAGRAAAAALAGTEAAPRFAEREEMSRHRRFQAALWTLFAADPPTLDALAPDTPVCRCEEVTAADLAEPMAEADTGIGSVKRATRAGMGRCQGRYCAHLIAPALAVRQGRPLGDHGFFAPRIPIKPVPVETVMAAGQPDEPG